MDRYFPKQTFTEKETLENLLIWKLGTQEHDCCTNYILPKKPTDFTFLETVELLKEIYG